MVKVRPKSSSSVALSVTAFVVALLVVSLIVIGAVEVHAQTVTLRLAGESALGTPGSLSAQRFAEIVEERSGGQIHVRFFPAGQLGTGTQLTEALQAGAVDMTWRALDWYTDFVKDWNILLLGFAFQSEDHVKAFLESPLQAELEEQLVKRAGIRILSANGIGAPRVLISKRPVREASDLEGLLIRVPNINMYVQTWRAAGASPMQVPWGDAYVALRQGVVDGLESPLGSIYGMKFHEAADYITLTNHVYSVYSMAINERAYQRLTEEQRQILREAALEAGRLYSEYDAESVASSMERLVEEGTTIIAEPDLDSFVERVAPLAERLEAEGFWSPGLFEKVQALRR